MSLSSDTFTFCNTKEKQAPYFLPPKTNSAKNSAKSSTCCPTIYCNGAIPPPTTRDYNPGKYNYLTNLKLRRDNFPRLNSDVLDCGIYWFKSRNEFKKFNDTSLTNDYFNPNAAETIIYVHGWQINVVSFNDRYTFDFMPSILGSKYDTKSTKDVDDEFGDMIEQIKLYRKTIDKADVNIGIFYWDQFSDYQLSDLLVLEKSIWPNLGVPPSWLSKTNVRISVPDCYPSYLFFLNYAYITQLLKPDSKIRLVGHSIGNQLIGSMLETLYDFKNNKSPTFIENQYKAIVLPKIPSN